MKSRRRNLQPDLFADDEPPIRLSSAEKEQMTQLVRVMLLEIVMTSRPESPNAATPAAVEPANEQDHA
jgi:hypothetical protein